MKFSENWLREWVDPAVDIDELCRQLTMAGLEVEEVTPAAEALDNVVVGAVETVNAHPQADKLTVCEVDCGGRAHGQIVCGAPNVRDGLRVPVALPGAHLPNGLGIATTELRGVRSEGMLCGSSELGLSDDSAGLLELDADAELGQPLADHLRLHDRIIEIDLTPNRGDCLSLRGVAREVGVWNRLSVTEPPVHKAQPSQRTGISVTVTDEQSCPAYVGRSIYGLDAHARTPDWMRERLRRSGIRPISPVVDVTNYVLLELGQPMHGFDQNTLDGKITVRRAADAEPLTLLDGSEVTLVPETLVIADDTGPVAMAGVMGGQRTAVGAATRDVFLESACFTPLAVAGQGRRYKLHTDSLHRFERGVDPELQTRALERATELIQAIAGGEAGEIVAAGPGTGARDSVLLRADRMARILGTRVPDDAVAEMLQRLEMQVETTDDGWLATPPSHRYDLAIESDLIEEVARIHGYDRLPAQPHPVFTAAAVNQEQDRPANAVREVLRQRGYDEAITYSFVDPQLQARLHPDVESLPLDNPIADNLSRMRTTLWASLIPCWLHNARRQQRRVRLFEMGLRFWREDGASSGIIQRETLAGLVSGPAYPEHWDTSARPLDFFDAKGDVEALLATSKEVAEFYPDTHPALHPGRCARIALGGESAGWVGQLHPDIGAYLDIKELPYVFELDYRPVKKAAVPRAAPVSEYPEVRRDLAFTVPDPLPAGRLRDVLAHSREQYLQSVDIFDVFAGGDLEAGFKSIALGLIFQDKTSTLTAEGVETAVQRLVQLAEEHCGAAIRGQ